MNKYEAMSAIAEKRIEELHEEIVGLNDYIADHPEISTNEFVSSKKIVDVMAAKGFAVEYPFANQETAFRGVYGNNQHKYKIAILAEYDALPEIGHGCGHCLSGSISVLAALALTELQDQLDADIHLIGTPDEEVIGGKVKMVREGVFDDYDAAMMIHLYDENLVFTKLLALDTYSYYFHGKASHASVCPWEGRNAFNASQLMFHAIDMLRQHVTPDVRIHGIIKYAGEAPNIVPEENAVEIYIRGLERENLNEVVRKVDDCARGAAIATQTTWDKKATAEVYDNMKAAPYGEELLRDVYGELKIPLNGDHDKIFGSSDTGNISMVCPVFHPTIQVVDSGVALHTREFANAMKTPRAHEVLNLGAKVISRQIIKLLYDDENIVKVKREFKGQ